VIAYSVRAGCLVKSGFFANVRSKGAFPHRYVELPQEPNSSIESVVPLWKNMSGDYCGPRARLQQPAGRVARVDQWIESGRKLGSAANDSWVALHRNIL
jgi:hypothetical protein